MTGTFLATWVRLRRRSLLVGTLAAAVAVTSLSTTLAFVLADTPVDRRPGPRGGAAVTTATLSTADGLLQGLSLSVTLFGIIAFCLAASTFAGEYGTGTIRTVLVRQPRRTAFVLGTWAALVSFVTVAVVVAAVTAAVLAVALAPSQGVDTGSWFTGEGLAASSRTALHVLIAAFGYTTLGSALGILVRAAVPAVVIGFGWLFLVETIVVSSAPRSARWLPGQLLGAVATGGTSDLTFFAALLTAAGYLVAAGGTALAAFSRRDVTA